MFTPALAAALRDLFETDRITALTARLAALEQATPEDLAEMAYKACVDAWHTAPTGKQHQCSVDAVIAAIAAPLRAQGAVVARLKALRDAERECEEIGEKFGTQELTIVGAAGMCATRIRKRIASIRGAAPDCPASDHQG